MKKYTPVFGPQELFDGAANCDEYLVAVQHSVGQKTKVSFYPSLVEAFNYVVDFPPRGVVFHRAAMRKIEEVPEPKRWTWEDKKAGRLPEVGAKYISDDAEFTCHYIDKSGDVWGHTKNDDVWCRSIGEIIPIETPEEMEQREEDEFVDSLRSVDIPAWGFFSQGARAAYRKLKGGE